MEINISGQQTKSKLFTAFVVFSLLLASFKNVIPGLDLGDILLVLSGFLLIIQISIDRIVIRVCSVEFLLIVLYLSFLILTLMNGVFTGYFSYYDVAIRLIRWFFYIAIIVWGSKVFYYEFAVLLIRKISIISSVFLLIQRLYLLLTGKAISFVILGKEIGNSVEYLKVKGVTTVINRPSSFFSEPAHLTFFSILALIFLLDDKRKEKKTKAELAECGLISAALILSTSTYAYFLMILLAGWYAVLYFRISRKHIIILSTVLIVFLIAVTQLDVIANRDILYFLTKVSHIGSTSRTTFFAPYTELLDGFHHWIGVGVGNEEYYMAFMHGKQLGYVNSVSITYLYCGVLGICIWGIFWICFFRFIGREQWLIGCVFLIMAICSTDFYGKFAVLYLLFINARATIKGTSIYLNRIKAKG